MAGGHGFSGSNCTCSTSLNLNPSEGPTEHRTLSMAPRARPRRIVALGSGRARMHEVSLPSNSKRRN